MRVIIPELEIGDTEGFTDAKDIFGRRQLGDALANLVQNVTDPMVIAVDAPWGAGKTVFLKMWAGQLRLAGLPVVYFDAFRNDFAEDAFVPIAAELIALTKNLKASQSTAKDRLFQLAADAGAALLPTVARGAVLLATANTVDIKGLDDAMKGAADDLSKQVADMLKAHTKHEEQFTAFRQALAELPGLLTGQAAGAAGGNKPLVVIIDELDRCRPNFALQVLERVKHFFSVENVHFVFGVNLDQLRNSVSAAYGAGIDQNTYLQKFVHLVVPLLEERQLSEQKTTARYLLHLKDNLQFHPQDRMPLDDCCELILGIAKHRDLSLRDLERIMTNLALALAASTPGGVLRLPPVVAGLCVLKVVNPKLYALVKTSRASYQAVASEFGFPTAPLADLSDCDFDERWWRYCLDKALSDSDLARMSEGVPAQYRGVRRFNLAPAIANNAVDRILPYGAR